MPMPRQEQQALAKLVGDFPNVTLGDVVLTEDTPLRLATGEDLFIWGIRTDLGMGKNVLGLGKSEKKGASFSNVELKGVKFVLLFDPHPDGSVNAQLLEVERQTESETVFRLYTPSITWHERI